MRRMFLLSIAALLVASLPVHAQPVCQVRVPSESLWANPLDVESSFGTLTLSEVVRTVADYPAISTSTEVVRLDGAPYIGWHGGVKSIYAATANGMEWIPYLDGALEVVGYYVTASGWGGPYPSGPMSLVLQNHTEWRVGVVSRYPNAWIPLRVWLTTRVC